MNYLHFGPARLEQRRQQHEVIVLNPDHVAFLVVIKHSLQQAACLYAPVCLAEIKLACSWGQNLDTDKHHEKTDVLEQIINSPSMPQSKVEGIL